MTDEANLELLNIRWGLELRKATHGPNVIERTAGAVWSQISAVNEFPFLWNVFPLHPHDPGAPFTNRRHNASERQVGLKLLGYLLEILAPNSIVTIGADAQAAVCKLGVGARYVRHPSYGGERAFAMGIQNLIVDVTEHR